MRTAERVVPAENLAIAGLVPLSAVDWPGRLVATVFCQGCPLRCPYCQNSSILDPTVPGAVPWGDVEDLLSRRRGLLDGVVFTGGEALRQEAVLDAMARVKAEGFMVGLHTAGVYPRRLEAALGHVDWVGLDIKALPGDYPEAVGAPGGKAWRALELVMEASAEARHDASPHTAPTRDGREGPLADHTPPARDGDGEGTAEAAGASDRPRLLDYEIRTTVYPGAPAAERFEELVVQLRDRGVKKFALQEARTEGTPVSFRADALAWDVRAWAERRDELVACVSGAGFEQYDIRLS